MIKWKILSSFFIMYDSFICSKATVHKYFREQLFWKILLCKNNWDGVLFKKTGDCDLTKKVLHHSFFGMNFVKFFQINCFLKHRPNTSVPLWLLRDFASFVIQNSILKNLTKFIAKDPWLDSFSIKLRIVI